jgi:hypothetical protein
MKYFKFITLAFSVLILTSCTNQNSGTAGNTTTNAIPVSSNSAKGTINCVIDGKPVSIKVEESFFEMNLDVDSKGPKDGLELLDGSAKKEGFQFEIKNTGSTEITNGSNDCIISYYNPAGVVYSGNNVLVTITSYSSGHLTGTFAGQFRRWNGGNKILMQITDGKFDLLQ